MRNSVSSLRGSGNSEALDLARVLLVHGELAPRLALQTILRAGGYSVDVAASPAEALCKLDKGRYELVLSDTQMGTRQAGDILAYARVKEYRPATALITSSEPKRRRRAGADPQYVAVRTENVPTLLSDIAELIGLRASRRYRPFRHAAV